MALPVLNGCFTPALYSGETWHLVNNLHTDGTVVIKCRVLAKPERL